MSPRRVLILNIQSLLVVGVQSILAAEDDLRVLSTHFDTHHALIAEVERLKPDVIILDECVTKIDPLRMIRLLRETQGLRLIVLNSHTSTMRIYEKREHTIASAKELLAAIR